jgi:hypothetical protein
MTYTLGDKVTVKLTNADLLQKHIDFQLINQELDEFKTSRPFVKGKTQSKGRKNKNKK